MEEWDAQKMLDLYIHDYMIRKNMHSAAQTFAEEANLNCDKALVINPPEGFLIEWWSLFWDVYSTKLENNTNATEGSSSMAAENVTQAIHLNMPIPEPNTSFVLPNVSPTIARPGPSNLTLIIGDSFVLRPVRENFPHNNAPIMRPMQEMNLNRSGKDPISNLNFLQGESFTQFLAARTREQERLKLPIMEESSSSRHFEVEQLACMLPAIGTSSDPLMRVNDNLLPPVRKEDESGSSMTPRDAEPTDGQNVIRIMREPTGSSASSNSLSSDSSS